ncbi:MAG: efflux RND transporter periplasmic adaptor subunit [Syntrophales bacterium]|jgi:RND family efflux transporter MFP subunit|nr:efflux RND transporter periplasmic adaptor subunit [Syntrophales bacterium]MCK9527341.1 efflux RND transporter periplasmic adaptor subunit [Syntrophales bacterium]MDX9921189.1 efflux RND transporter periplasmic adaptor subunit [Syntrophales bacterium]
MAGDNHKEEHNKNASIFLKFLVFCFFLFTVLVTAAGCGNDTDTGRVQPPPPGEKLRVSVEVVSVRTGEIYAPIHATGTVVPVRESRVGARVSGRILAAFVDEGDDVVRGQALAELEQEDYRLARNSAAAQLAAGRASLDEARLNLVHAAREKERMEHLYERHVISRQNYDTVITAHAMALARVEALAAQAKAAEAALEIAERNLADAAIPAPFSGYVARKMTNQGEIVAPGTPLFLIFDISRVRTEVKIPEADLGRISVGTPVVIELNGIPGRLFQGAISEINATIDPVSRNFTVKIDIPNDERHIRAGMFARVTIKTDAVADVIIVPERALVTDGEGKTALFVLDGDRARFRRVRTGMRAGGLVAIDEGLVPGEPVLVSGNFGLADDEQVAARDAEY